MNKYLSFFLSLAISIFLFLLFNYSNNKVTYENVEISRIIDGDTLVLEDGRIIRLLNINTPEKDTTESNLSISYLKSFEGENINLQITGQDKYNRYLGRLYSPEYINLEIINKGYGVKFLVDNKELKKFYKAEEEAILNSRGIWEKSPYKDCLSVSLNQFKEIIKIDNLCEIKIEGWRIRDESRKEYVFSNVTSNSFVLHSSVGKNNSTDIFWNQKTDVWNNDHDTLYIFDNKNRLVFHMAYGY